MGWVALVGPELEENLSLRYLAASLSEFGFDSKLFPFNSGRDLLAVLAAIEHAPTAPRLVAVSLAFQWRANDGLALILALRARGYTGHITVGGHFGTFVYQEILRDFPELDSVCRFEAETSIVELARATQPGSRALAQRVVGVSTRGTDGQASECGIAPPDISRLAWPDRRGEPASCLGHPIAAMVASRGCYASCAFCCIAAWHEAQHAGERFRLRPVDDVADEMVWLNHELGRDIFIFHDDNFFVPNKREGLVRIHALADELERRGMGRFASVVKARPTDVTREMFSAMRDRLGCIRVFLGVENDATQGLKTLNRKVTQRRNHEAIAIVRELDLYVCFNMLIFDPDATFESLETNLDFITEHGHYPSNFGRVELYAGTPLLARMRREGRTVGDYIRWDYAMATPAMQRVFEIAMACFYPRNFAAGALANRLQGTRFDVHVCRHFHPELLPTDAFARVEALSRELAEDSAATLREIIEVVRREASDRRREELIAGWSERLRDTERRLGARATALEEEIQAAVGVSCHHGRSTRSAAAGTTAHVPPRGSAAMQVPVG